MAMLDANSKKDLSSQEKSILSNDLVVMFVTTNFTDIIDQYFEP